MKKMFALILALVLLLGACAKSVTIGVNSGPSEYYNSAAWEDLDKAHQFTKEIMSSRDVNALQYEPHGVYNLTGYTCKVYTFDSPNDFYEVVMFDENEDFAFIIHNTGARGISFHCVTLKGYTFKGLTANYVIFESSEGTVGVSMKMRDDVQVGDYAFEVIPFAQLPEEEQATAIYPNGSYVADFRASEPEV